MLRWRLLIRRNTQSPQSRTRSHLRLHSKRSGPPKKFLVLQRRMWRNFSNREAGNKAAQLYTKVAALEATKAAFEDTVRVVLNSQMRPVSDEINRRWDAVFPDRPGLRFTPEGELYRVFDDELANDLEFTSFSSGEKAVAKLMMRLSVLRSTTEIPFCVLDEPLEHLDPDSRSYVAQALSHLSGPGSLDQIFVTTYEQALALELASRASGQVHLEFLRTAHVS